MARPRDDDEAPWLAEVDAEPRGGSAPSRRVFGGVVFAALLVLLVGVGLYVIVSKKQGGADGLGAALPGAVPLITADPGPYKVLPTDPGGMTVDGTGQTIYSAGGGEDPGGQIDPGLAPEEIMPRPGSEPPATATELLPPAMTGEPATTTALTAEVPPPATDAPKPPVAKPVPVSETPVATPAPGSPRTLQLGAFSSPARAEAAWASLAGRYTYLAALTKRIEPVAQGGATLYRLRAAGAADNAAASELCARLKVAGESCMVTE